MTNCPILYVFVAGVISGREVTKCPGWPADSYPGSVYSPRDDYTSDGKYYKVCQKLKEVPQNISAESKEVELNGNLIKVIRDTVFSNLTSCTKLWLVHNKISYLEKGAFSGLSSLEELRLDYNQLGYLPAEAFHGLSSLQMLRLEYNELASIPDKTFHSVSSLKELRLEGNKLDFLPAKAFHGLYSLQKLRLEYNQLVSLPSGVFRDLTSLQSLNLGYNHLASLQAAAFHNMSCLQTLRLEYNKLTFLPDGIFPLPALKQLHLHNNNLNSLPWTLFDPTAYQESKGHPAELMLSLSGNPFQCDSRACWIRKAETERWLEWHTYPKCSGNDTWSDFTFTCTKTGKYYPECSGNAYFAFPGRLSR